MSTMAPTTETIRRPSDQDAHGSLLAFGAPSQSEDALGPARRQYSHTRPPEGSLRPA